MPIGQAIVTHVEHIGKIIAAQQTYARRGGVTEEIDVAELIEHARCTALLGQHGSDGPPRDTAVVGRVTLDRHKMMQIMGNLLSNARHALRDQTQGPREVTVRMRAIARGVLRHRRGGFGHRDRSAESMQRLFEFGFTTKKDGHGFGLHASAILAKEMGGELSARSDGPSRGARFSLRLPVAAADAEPAEEERVNERDRPGRRHDSDSHHR